MDARTDREGADPLDCRSTGNPARGGNILSASDVERTSAKGGHACQGPDRSPDRIVGCFSSRVASGGPDRDGTAGDIDDNEACCAGSRRSPRFERKVDEAANKKKGTGGP
ncbi:hypothetical protein HPB50_023559 [Hyalomma asiaticum]|uniref:Uncharacterized protein n=1 Tax=Hyalomma asiaticum TaxID=266040 RepID=A0ACB7S8Q8_HYAAI|nr:hypothetical protein HPB50_023559 [Hyalomma asiaticum]